MTKPTKSGFRKWKLEIILKPKYEKLKDVEAAALEAKRIRGCQSTRDHGGSNWRVAIQNNVRNPPRKAIMSNVLRKRSKCNQKFASWKKR